MQEIARPRGTDKAEVIQVIKLHHYWDLEQEKTQ